MDTIALNWHWTNWHWTNWPWPGNKMKGLLTILNVYRPLPQQQLWLPVLTILLIDHSSDPLNEPPPLLMTPGWTAPQGPIMCNYTRNYCPPPGPSPGAGVPPYRFTGHWSATSLTLPCPGRILSSGLPFLPLAQNRSLPAFQAPTEREDVAEVSSQSNPTCSPQPYPYSAAPRVESGSSASLPGTRYPVVHHPGNEQSVVCVCESSWFPPA